MDIGLLAVSRVALMQQAKQFGALEKRVPALDLPFAEVFNRYHGFDGVPWPSFSDHIQLEDGLANLDRWPVVNEYIRSLSKNERCEVVLLCQHGATALDSDLRDWYFAGYDCGFYESQWSHFSVILNEVLWGIHEELRAFARQLNAHLLLDSESSVHKLKQCHDQLAQRGADVEELEYCGPVGIFRRRSPE